MSSIIDLDSDTCSSDPIEAINYLKEQVIFKISKRNPLYHDIVNMGIEVVKDDGDQIYFKIKSSG
ncbi:hypothetical protein [Sulfuracidifex tepidarius]|uniref:Uncharacterized protein n=1 Tax=Sulfuracidifex tepidarius TaxID=1294262 RepID=A0A510DYF7_9CREN|nr:hypothetical protein [Sulfuracidifex tepidarius]BBG25251.1 hypothetical protein IC006_2586 [Sulfuracidifex tepidarius]BBG28045.1 hypothetical protein IC007_2600 [Sulfuracidifex tepidarius]